MEKEITDEERQFMLDEFGLTPDAIDAMNEDEYWALFMDVAEIEAFEGYDEEGYPKTKRAKLACSIVDKMYTD